MLAVSLPPARQMTPRAARREANFTVAVEGPTITPFTSPVANVSATGMLLKNAGQLRAGDILYASIAGGAAILCVVARLSRGGGAGIKFASAQPQLAPF